MAARTANAPRSGAPQQRPPAGGARPQTRPVPAQPKLDVRLRILDGPGAGMEYALAGPVVRLGRGDENDIVLQDGNASRVHAEVVRDGSGRFLVRDLGSRNGIFVNRKKVPSASLKGGDRILIGSTQVEFIAAGGSSKGASAGGGGVNPLVMVGVAAAVVAIGFVGILALHGHPSGPNPSGTPDPKDLLQHDPNQVDITTLLGQKPQPGVAVNRNDTTKPSGVLPAGAVKPVTNNSTAGMVSDGDRAYSSGRLVDARADYFRASQLDPNDKAIAAKLHRVESEILTKIDQAFRAGNTYADTGRYQEAKDMYKNVQFLDPDPNSENYTNAQVRITDMDRKIQAQSESGLH